MRCIGPALAALALLAATAQAQQPYAGLETRTVKALSADQIADLRAGRGMGLALAAELNGYPGPTHLLELADALRLTPDQRGRVEQLFRSMKAETIPLGEELIAQETELDRQFAGRSATLHSLTRAVEGIAATQARLRTAHLKYHLLTVELLEPEQIHRYNELRGYAGGDHSAGHGRRH